MSKTTPAGINIKSADGSSLSISPELATNFARMILPDDTKVAVSTSGDKASALAGKSTHEKA